MKKVLVAMTVLFCVASVSQASILNTWATAAQVGTTTTWDISIYTMITPDVAAGETWDDVQNGFAGLTVFGVTVYTPGTVGVAVPKTTTVPTLKYVGTTGGDKGTFEGATLPFFINPTWGDYDADGDKDLVLMGFGTPAADGPWEIGAQGVPQLVGKEHWTIPAGQQAFLSVHAADNSPLDNGDKCYQFDANSPAPAYRRLFTGYVNTGVTIGTAPTAVKPTLTLGASPTRVNTATGSATITLTATKTAGDAAVSSSFLYGDGSPADPKGGITTTLNVDHLYTITSGTSQTFTASVTGTNPGGTSTPATTDVTLLVAPQVVLLVNGAPATDGQIFGTPEFWGHNPVLLSLADSTGYIESWSMMNGATVLASGSGSVGGIYLSPDTYELYGPGVTFNVSNTGSGANSSSMTVQFVPEPATLALLGIGAMATLLRRKK